MMQTTHEHLCLVATCIHPQLFQLMVSLPVLPNGPPFGLSLTQSKDPDSTKNLTVIRVLQVQPQSAAAIAGVRPGDELVKVGWSKVGLHSPQFLQKVAFNTVHSLFGKEFLL